MRILLATDGSDSAAVASELSASMAWPAGSTIRVLAVVERPVGIIPWVAPGPGNLGVLYEAIIHDIDRALDATEATLRQPGVTVESVRREGRAATRIVDEAKTFEADHAPCPVLVARRSEIGDVLVSDDGSPAAARARQVIATWAPFEDTQVTVLSVAEVSGPWIVGVAPTMYDDVLAAHAADVAAATEQARAIARAGAEGLEAAGRRAEAITAEGDAAHRILETAKARGSGLLVLGTRGRTGVVRAMLGSVARNVLHHAEASVLIVR